jgi:serine/threonine protein kinase
MELVEGRSLAAAMPKGGLPLDRLLKIAIPVADAMAAAHHKGITHRDLKPANIMLGEGEQDGASRCSISAWPSSPRRRSQRRARPSCRPAPITGRRPHPRHRRVHVARAGGGKADRRAL